MPEFPRSTNESPQPAKSAPSAGSKSGRTFENEDVDVLANAADGSFLELVTNRSRGPSAPSTATPMPAYGSATPEAAARFVCALALAKDASVLFEAQGVVSGEIAPESSGVGGFGYDPIFFYPPFGCTFAEAEDRKSAMTYSWFGSSSFAT